MAVSSNEQSCQKSALFVCLGNTCRSTMAEGIFRHLVQHHGLQDQWHIDSAGIADWHVGKPPDMFTMSQLHKNGMDGYNHTARQIQYKDFTTFQYILCMDKWNLRALEQYKPEECTAQIKLLGSYDIPGESKQIYDPFMSEEKVFEEVFTKCYRCCKRFLISHHPEIDDERTEH